jgi:transketolase
VEDLGVMRMLPGMTVVAPADPVETRLATRALVEHDGPCYLRLGKASEPVLHATTPQFALGKAITVRQGFDVTLISTGGMLQEALLAADQLEANGSTVRVLSMHTVKPVDEEAVLCAARETAAIVTAEEHSVTGGLGTAVADVLAQARVRMPVFRKYGIPDELNHLIGSQGYLRRALAGELADTVQSVCRRRRAA